MGSQQLADQCRYQLVNHHAEWKMNTDDTILQKAEVFINLIVVNFLTTILCLHNMYISEDAV